MKKGMILAGALLLAAGTLFAQGSKEGGAASSAGSGKQYVIKFANTQGEKDTQSMGLAEVAKRLEATGLFKVELYYSSSLGETDDLTEQAINGAPVLTVSDPGRLMSFVPEFGVIQMPYMFSDASALNKLVETDTYKLRCASCETTLAIDDRICCYTVGGMRFVDSDAFIGMTVQQILRNMQILLHAAGIMHIIACRQEIIVGAKGCPASQIVVGVLN